MIKHLITPLFALVLSFSVNAQVHIGLGFDYEHIQASSSRNIGSGSGYGGSLFFRVPLSSHWSLDWSVDLASGHTQTNYWVNPPFTMGPPLPAIPASEKRSFLYGAIPLHVLYDQSFQHVRVFAGPGLSYSRISGMEKIFLHADRIEGNCTVLAVSLMAGCELYQHVVLSGEFRPWKFYLSDNGNKISNLVSVKVGYAIKATKHSSRSRSHT